MRNLKIQITLVTLLTLLLFFSTPSEALAAQIQSLNGSSVQNQTFQNDSNVTISTNTATGVHSLGWNSVLSVLRGGTGANSFTNGSLLFFNGSTFAQNNSKLFWDNTNNRLGVGTSTPTAILDVNGTAKVTSLTSTNDSTINGLTIGLGGGSGIYNTAVGAGALSGNTTGNENVAIGFDALSSNSGFYNTAIGSQVGGGGGSGNTAVGRRAGGVSTGGRNTAVGWQSLLFNTGAANTSIGSETMVYNTTGHDNVGVGPFALSSNTTGSLNVALGTAALLSVTGDGNIAVGYEAGRWQADGTTALTNATSNIYIGSSSRGYNNSDGNSIVLGTNAIGAGVNTTVIGNSSMADVYFGSSSANANIHAKKLFLGSSSLPGCIVMGDINGSVGYITLVNGVLTTSTTPPSACQ